jgi:pyrroline-5-carboxylate reductase
MSDTIIQGQFGFLGYGNMGSAILGGLLKRGVLTADQVLVYDPDPARMAAAEELGVRAASSSLDLARACDTLLLAVKPQTMTAAMKECGRSVKPDALLISIAAGISITFLRAPNTPALVQAGAAGIALGLNCLEEDAATVKLIFDSVGIAEIVPESHIDAVTGVSGSGPAYFFYMVECMTQAGVELGLDAKVASRLAAQTLYGAGKLLHESGESPEVLRKKVTSKGGTTAAAIKQMEDEGFDLVIQSAVKAAAKRSHELGS